MKRTVAAVLVILAYLLHQDVWFWHIARPLVFGFLPIGLFYHVAYVIGLSLLFWLLVTYLWPSHLDE